MGATAGILFCMASNRFFDPKKEAKIRAEARLEGYSEGVKVENEQARIKFVRSVDLDYDGTNDLMLIEDRPHLSYQLLFRNPHPAKYAKSGEVVKGLEGDFVPRQDLVDYEIKLGDEEYSRRLEELKRENFRRSEQVRIEYTEKLKSLNEGFGRNQHRRMVER